MEGLRAGKLLKEIAAAMHCPDGSIGVSTSAAGTQQTRAQLKLGAKTKEAALRSWARHRRLYIAREKLS